MKWWPFFNFFIMADSDILFPSTLRKPETQTLGGQYLTFFRMIHIYKMSAISHVFIMTDADILFLSILGKPENFGK